MTFERFDGYISGPIADDFYYMVGGYITSSPGLRDAGYNSDEGNQFTINLTRVLDRGKVNVFYRQTDDYGQWYLPVALNVPGVDAGYNQLGSRNRIQEIFTTNSGPDFANGGDPAAPNPTIERLDLDEGRGWKGSVTGGSVVLEVSDAWTLTDRFGLTTGDANTTGLVPDGGAVQVGALLADPAVDPRAVVTGPITGAVTGRAIGAGEFIQQFGAWEVLKDVDAFTNDISLTWDFDRGSATFGYYASSVSSNDLWALGNSEYQVVEQGGEIVTGIACNDPAIDSCGFNYDIDGRGDATTNALYAATSFDITDSVDGGRRGPLRGIRGRLHARRREGRHDRFRRVGRRVGDLVDGGPQLPVHGPDGRLRAHQPGSLVAAVRHLSGQPRRARQRQ